MRIAAALGLPTALPWSAHTTLMVLANTSRTTKNGIRGLSSAIADAHNSRDLHNPFSDPIVRRGARGARRLAPKSARKGFPITMKVYKRARLNRLSAHPVWAAITTTNIAGTARIGDTLPADGRVRFTPKVRDLSLFSADGLSRIPLHRAVCPKTGSYRATRRLLGKGWYFCLHRPAHSSKTFDEPFDIPFAHRYATRAYQRYLRHRVATSGPLRPSAPLFSRNGTNPVSRKGFLKRTSSIIRRAGIFIDPRLFRGISLRAGGATALYEAGYSDAQVKACGRWLSDAFTIYAHISAARIAAASRSM